MQPPTTTGSEANGFQHKCIHVECGRFNKFLMLPLIWQVMWQHSNHFLKTTRLLINMFNYILYFQNAYVTNIFQCKSKQKSSRTTILLLGFIFLEKCSNPKFDENNILVKQMTKFPHTLVLNIEKNNLIDHVERNK